MLTTFKINKADSGWPSGFTPSEDEIKAYFLGWRLCDADGAPYVSGDKYWHKWTDLSGLTDTCPTESYVGSERHLAIAANSTGEEISVDIDTDLRIYSGDNYIGADTPGEIDLVWEEIKESIEDRLITNHKYLVYIEGKGNDTGILAATLTVTNGVTTVQADPWTESDTSFVRRFLSFTAETVDDWKLKIVTGDTAATPVDYTFRNLNIIDLTEMGELNAAMKEYYSADNWADLTDNQLEDYFDQIGHIDVAKATGWSWAEDTNEILISNYGESPDINPLSSIKIPTQLHGMDGYIETYNTDLNKKTALFATKMITGDCAVDSSEKYTDLLVVDIDLPDITSMIFPILFNPDGSRYIEPEIGAIWDRSNESPSLTREVK